MRAMNRKRSKASISINQSQYSAKNQLVSFHASVGRTKLATVIGGRFSKLHYLEKMQMIKNVMHNLYGRHYAIDYKPQFNFQQSWQSCQKQTHIEDNYSVLKTQNYLYIGLHFTLCILFGLITWFFTVYRLFEIHNILFGLISTIMVVLVGDAIVKQYLLYEAMESKQVSTSTLTVKDYLSVHKWGLLFFVYLCLLLIEEALLIELKSKALFVVDLIFVWISYQRFKELYSALKIKILASKYRNEIMIMQLFGSVILFVHIFSVFLYLVSFVSRDNNWTTQIPGFSESWVSKYVYSLYFACTTALTVGYGDVTPQNLFEIVAILCIQILGLINMGYIVSEIGRILSKMNESQEMLHKNISEAEKITKNYELPGNIVNKMRKYIINNQIASNQLNVEEEDSFMRRLNDQLRDEVTSHNQLRIIKTSMFFLCHWSKKFQRKIATKLIRCLYSPHQTISQIHGNEKLYILTKGKLQIQAFISKNPSSEMTRCLNFLECKDKDEVHFNVYGYSALISGLAINLKAVVRDYSICYKVDKEDILKTIVQTKKDFEYFHQIKARIEQSRFKQIFQAPNIANTREHYLPNPYFIIKKDRNKLKRKNKRNEMMRSNRRQKIGIQTDRQISEQEIESEAIISQASNQIAFNLDPVTISKDKNLNALLTAKEREQKYKASQEIMITSRNYRRKNPKKIMQMNTVDLDRQQKLKIIESLDEQKSYKHFQPKYNMSSVLLKYRSVWQKDMKFETGTKSEVSKAVEQLCPDLVERLLTFKKVGSCYSIN